MSLPGVGVTEKCFCDRLVKGSGCDTEPCGDFAAVDDEWLFELILHFKELPHHRAGNGQGAPEQRRDRPDPCAVLPGLTVDGVDKFLGAARAGVVGQMPDFPGGVRVLTPDGEAFTDVRDVGIGVGLVPSPSTVLVFPARAAGKTRSPRFDCAPPRGPK